MTKIILTVAVIILAMQSPVAYATPGAVTKQGCHGKPKHCHASSDISRMRNGRRYVPFGRG